MKILRHPYEYFAAQIYFANKMKDVSEKSLQVALFEYTDLYSSLTQKDWGDQENKGIYSSIWNEFTKKIEEIIDIDEICSICFEHFKKQEFSMVKVKQIERYKHYDTEENIGCFTFNFNDLNKNKEQIRLHFRPMRNGLLATEKEKQVGDLATYYFEERKKEFEELVRFVKDKPSKFKEFKYLTSSTWLQNIPNYQKLFPQKYTLNENREKRNDSFLGLWGQFERWDNIGNTKTFAILKNNLSKAKTKEEIIDAFPNPVYRIKIPLEELFSFYSI